MTLEYAMVLGDIFPKHRFLRGFFLGRIGCGLDGVGLSEIWPFSGEALRVLWVYLAFLIPSRMLTVLRWVAYLPFGFCAAMIGGCVGTAGARFGEFIGFTTSGAFSAAGFICAGLAVAPKRNNIVKWTLVIPSFFMGILSAIGESLSEDKLRMSIGISMAVVSLTFAAMPAKEIFPNNKTESD